MSLATTPSGSLAETELSAAHELRTLVLSRHAAIVVETAEEERADALQADVFVVATANDLSALPPELLRKGRFDEIFFVDLPDLEEREAILRIHLTLRKQDPARFDVERIAAAAEGFSGAELEQVISASLLRALQAGEPLSTEIVLQELSATVPLSRSRAEDVERLRTFARERFMPVR